MNIANKIAELQSDINTLNSEVAVLEIARLAAMTTVTDKQDKINSKLEAVNIKQHKIDVLAEYNGQ